MSYDAEAILNDALTAQDRAGRKNAPVTVHVNRHPTASYVKFMQLESRRGPFGQIVKLTEEGTIVEFEADKLIQFLTVGSRKSMSWNERRDVIEAQGRKQIHPTLRAELVETMALIASRQAKTVNEIVDQALSAWLEKYGDKSNSTVSANRAS